MAQAAIIFRDEQLLSFLDEVKERTGNIKPLLEDWGKYVKGITQDRFHRGGPGWPPKNPYFAELQRRSGRPGNAPLKDRGRLAGSITYDIVSGSTMRVGSPLRYGAMHQFGSTEQRGFYIFILPDKNPDGTMQRDEKGRLLGKIVLRQHGAGVKKQLIKQRTTARPYLKEPDVFEEAEMLKMAEKYLIEHSGGER